MRYTTNQGQMRAWEDKDIQTLFNGESSSTLESELALRSSHSSADTSASPSSLRIRLKDRSSLFKFTRVSNPVIDMILARSQHHTTGFRSLVLDS